jgi:hypothetical protein
MKDQLETLLLITIIVIFTILIYIYWNNGNDGNDGNNGIKEGFIVNQVLSIQDGAFEENPIWTNFVKKSSQLPISIVNPIITDNNIQRILGHSIINSYQINYNKPYIVNVVLPEYTPTPVTMTKLFEVGSSQSTINLNTPTPTTIRPDSISLSSALTSSNTQQPDNYYRNIYNQTQYSNLLYGKLQYYLPNSPLQYKVNINNVSTSFNINYNNDTTQPIIQLIDQNVISIDQLNDEIAKITSTIKAYRTTSNLEYANKLRNFYSDMRIGIYNYTNNDDLYGGQYQGISINNGYGQINKLNDNINSKQPFKVIQIPLGIMVDFYSNINLDGYLMTLGSPIGTEESSELLKIYGDKTIFTKSIRVSNYGSLLILSGYKGNFLSISWRLYDDTVDKLVSIGKLEDISNGSTVIDVLNNYNNRLQSTLTSINNFNNTILNNNVDMPAISCWSPVAPENFVTVGHVIIPKLGLTSIDTTVTNIQNKIACIPIHCYRKVRDWVASDMIYSYQSGTTYFAIYKNPFTNTFIATTSRDLPSSYVGKIIPCPVKDYTIDNIILFDSKIRKNCKNYKLIKSRAQVTSQDYNTDEDNYLQKTIYDKEKKIQELKTYANKLQLSNDKGTIINQEFNRSQMSNYLDKQRDRIDGALKLLEEGRNKVDFNMKYPASIISSIIDYVANTSSLSIDQKVTLISTLNQIQNTSLSSTDARNSVIAALTTCPQFDLSGYIKKDPPCYGCNLPSS